MAWLYLLIAAAFEIAFASSMKAAEGFTHIWWTVATAISVIAAIGFLTLALKELPLSIAYTTWTGLGIVGSVALGLIVFNEDMTVVKAVGVLSIVAGVLVLRFAAPQSA